MRFFAIAFAALLLVLTTSAQDEVKVKKPTRRFGFDVDQFTYPQKTPAETMKSIATALDRKRVDYLLAQIVDPKFVDDWVGQYSKDFSLGTDEGKLLLGFDRLVRETTRYHEDDPLLVRELRAYAREAEWEEKEDLAVGTVKSIPTRKVYLRRIDDRWYLENRQQ